MATPRSGTFKRRADDPHRKDGGIRKAGNLIASGLRPTPPLYLHWAALAWPAAVVEQWIEALLLATASHKPHSALSGKRGCATRRPNPPDGPFQLDRSFFQP